MDSASLAPRIAELEARFTLQQDLLDKLSEELWRQQREIDALRARAGSLESRVAAMTAGGEEPPGEDPPPHY